MDGVAMDIVALNELLGEHHDRECEEEQHAARTITPASLCAAGGVPQGGEELSWTAWVVRQPLTVEWSAVTRPIGQIKPADPKAIWQPEEVPSDDEDDDAFETRARPKFEIRYKQSVMTEDVFLGLSDKDPSSAHCEAMVVRVECPRHRLEDIELDVKKHKLLLQSSSLKLVLYLPYPVKYQDGRAKWDAKSRVLSVTLPIVREEW